MPTAPAAPAEITVNGFGLALCGIALVITIFLNVKKNYSLSVLAMVSAFLIGVGYMGMNVNEILNSWPITTVISIILAVSYFGILSDTGMMTKLGKRIVRLVGGDVRKLPLVAVPAATLVALVSSMNVPFIFGPMLAPVAMAGGMDLIIVIYMLVFSMQIGSSNPWTSMFGQIIGGTLRSSGLENVPAIQLSLWVSNIIVFVITIALVYVACKGYKAKKIDFDVNEDLSMDPKQKKAFILFIGTIALLLIPSILTKIFPGNPVVMKIFSLCGNYIVFSVGLLLCTIMGLGSFEQALKKVPMGVVMMIVTILMLLTVAEKAGFSAMVSSAISNNVPRFLIPAVFTLVSCLLSYFASFFALLPILWAVAMPVCVATGLSPALLIACICIGAGGSGSASPMSSGGAVMLSVMPPEQQPQLGKRMLIWALIFSAFWTVLAALGLFNVAPAMFGC